MWLRGPSPSQSKTNWVIFFLSPLRKGYEQLTPFTFPEGSLNSIQTSIWQLLKVHRRKVNLHIICLVLWAKLSKNKFFLFLTIVKSYARICFASFVKSLFLDNMWPIWTILEYLFRNFVPLTAPGMTLCFTYCRFNRTESEPYCTHLSLTMRPCISTRYIYRYADGI